MKYLFIAEKPSLMRDVQSCYKKHQQEVQTKVGQIEFVALSGHVCRNATPEEYPQFKGYWDEVEYPMIPNPWVIRAITDKRKQEILKNIKKAASSFDGFIVGTDSDVEGYGIYYLLENFLGLSKKKALRFVEHSLTDSEILKSLLQMTDYHNDPIHIRNVRSFLLRSQADWLYGMNVTRLMSLKTGKTMKVGRVKAPTIKLVYDNSIAIENFRPQTYYQLTADYGGISGVSIHENGKIQNFEKKTAVNLPLNGMIKEVQKQTVDTHAPQLYDLTILQGEAGQTFGMSPKEVLDTVQSLYEIHKVISYPRTQCRYVSEEKAKEFPAMLSQMTVFPALKPYLSHITKEDIARVQKDKKVVNTAEVEKESHDALLPTNKTPDLSKMNQKEIQICEMIYKRLLAQFLPTLKECKTRMITEHGNVSFLITGKVVENQGWRELYGGLKDKAIPELKKGAPIAAKSIGFVEKTTKPPKRLTQAALVLAMKGIANQIDDPALKKSLAESQGIGTPATRDNIITDIIRSGYVEERNKKGLYITDLGRQYVENLIGIDIISPAFAARLDTEIKKIQRGEEEFNDVYDDMLKNLHTLCDQIGYAKPVVKEMNCPCCGKLLKSRKYSYDCESCGWKINKSICGVEITEEIMQCFKDDTPTEKLTFKKKDGKTFEAALKKTKEGIEFSFN